MDLQVWQGKCEHGGRKVGTVTGKLDPPRLLGLWLSCGYVPVTGSGDALGSGVLSLASGGSSVLHPLRPLLEYPSLPQLLLA